MKYRIVKIKHSDDTYYYPQYSNTWAWSWHYFDFRHCYPIKMIRFSDLEMAKSFIRDFVEPNLTLPNSECYRVDDYLRRITMPSNNILVSEKEKMRIKEREENYPVGVTKDEGIEYEIVNLD